MVARCDECQNFLQILGITQPATDEQLKVAYRDYVRVWHPDRFDTDARLRVKAEEETKRINAAYHHLCTHKESEPCRTEEPIPWHEPTEKPDAAPWQEVKTQHEPQAGQRVENHGTRSVSDEHAAWRWAKVCLRAVWRVFKIALMLSVGALLLLFLVIKLFQYFDNRNRHTPATSVTSTSVDSKVMKETSPAPVLPASSITNEATPIGDMYANGTGVEKDDTQAIYWFQKAAEQGNADMQNKLGGMYLNGAGVEKDETQAVFWYRKAAEQGNADGQNKLGFMYFLGRGVEKDDTQAIYWFQKAAEQGNADGQFYLGLGYLNGSGVEKDYTQAVFWFRKAAEQGNADGQSNLGFMYFKGWGVENDYSQAIYWFRKAAEKGNAAGQSRLGVMYANGTGVEKSNTQAAYLFRKAGEQGNADGQYNLGVMYETGAGFEKDYTQAAYWYRKAAEQGYEPAMNALDTLLTQRQQ
jgi:TPR repeat protein